MQLKVGDRLADETGEREIISRPYTTAGGKTAHVRVQRVGQPDVTDLLTLFGRWSSQPHSLAVGGTLVDEVKAIRLGLLISLIVTMSTACASTATAPPLGMTTTTLMAGWEQHFMVEWAAAEQSPNARKVTGYVYNRHGEYAPDLRLLAQALDSSGAVIGQRIAWVPGGLGGSGRAYFEVPNLPVASSYRVSVWDYTWIQGPKDRR